MKVSPVSKALSGVFKENFLRIPRFQRPYSWDKENISEFWYDLIERSEDEYFMGSLVLYQDRKEPNFLYIVDGQQRLATITLTLALIRDTLDEFGERSLATGVHNFNETPDVDNKDRFILEHDPRNTFFQSRIQQRHPDHDLKPKPGEQTAP